MVKGVVAVAVATILLSGCGAEDGTDSTSASGGSGAGSASATGSATPAAPAAPAIEGDGTWEVGADVEPGVYVGEGGEECQYQRLGDLDAKYPDVIVRGFLQRPVIEIMDGDGGFRTEGCGAWTALEDYSGTPATELPGDGIWLVGEDVEPGTYVGEGGEWCLWQRMSAFEPVYDSIIKGGSSRRATVGADDVAFYTEGCGSWTKTG